MTDTAAELKQIARLLTWDDVHKIFPPDTPVEEIDQKWEMACDAAAKHMAKRIDSKYWEQACKGRPLNSVAIKICSELRSCRNKYLTGEWSGD